MNNRLKLVLHGNNKEGTVIDVAGVKVGSQKLVVFAGPCAVESREQILETAKAVRRAGAAVLRGSAFKLRTSPYSFQGLGKEGLELLSEARKETGLPIVTELHDVHDAELVSEHADIIQIGARNMRNFPLLKAAAKLGKPILLKNGMAATMQEFLYAAECILAEGNPQLILCLRGTRSFETETRFALDLALVPALKKTTHLPVLVDPSHAAGKAELVPALAKAAVAAGADGLLVEVHCNPEKALSDAQQALSPQEFAKLMQELKRIAEAVGREPP